MKTLEDEWYVVMKAYKCTVSEIWRDFFVSAYIACMYVVSLHTESTDSVIQSIAVAFEHCALRDHACAARTFCGGSFTEMARH